MSIDRSDVEKIAHLARLQINEQQRDEYCQQINSILQLVEQMQQVNTDNIDPMAHPMNATQRLREDIVTEENQRELLQANAPAVEKGLFLVPKVIE